ncbi:hypothetical protein HK405_000770 [Cladochytrium tenue]|nr:hypothetical protein HK405_000770 [Cladochytrium tenue]
MTRIACDLDHHRAAGWLGGLLAHRLLTDDKLPGLRMVLTDIVEPRVPAGAAPGQVLALRSDLRKAEDRRAVYETAFGAPDVVYALHGIMSRGSEEDFDLGMSVNIDSIRGLLEEARRAQQQGGARAGLRPPRFVFTSSLAVFGGPLPDVVAPRNTPLTPEGSYGCGKAVSEMLVSEYSRRGFVDGVSLRLPTIVVRPGPPSFATSAFVSGIVREPLQGQEAVCPVGRSFDDPALDEVRLWVTSPENVIENFVVAAHVDGARFPAYSRSVNLPGFTVSVKQELDALKAVGGQKALNLVRFEEDATNRRIVCSWPSKFDNQPAVDLGFVPEPADFVEITRRFQKSLAK